MKPFHKLNVLWLGAFMMHAPLGADLQETNNREEENVMKWAEELGRKYADQKSEDESAFGKCSSKHIEHQECNTIGTIMCFISLALPVEMLLELSKQLEEVNGVFVLRGFPTKGAIELGEKISALRKKGSRIPILIDPRAFRVYEVDRVPTFVVFDGEKFDKVTGSISLKYALELFREKGETNPKYLQEKTRATS